MKRPVAWVCALLVELLLVLFMMNACSGDDETSGKPTPEDAGTGGGAADGDGGPDSCVPKTCAQLGAECGTAPDGCAGVVECGKCTGGDHCGGGGQNKCGTDPCTPKTCAQVNASCGYASDSCATAIDCGSCLAPQTCGGASKPNQCGCVPKTCAELGADCGDAPDGCGGQVSCGACPSGQSCGGNGPNKCGTGGCSPKTCTQLGASCGSVSDQCSMVIDCGGCAAPQTCGGGGQLNQCGCIAKTCVSLSLSCGPAQAGCGTMLDCGNCTVANATATCVAGACQLGPCNAGFGDCNGDPLDGCETNLKSDPNHCASCTKVCTAPTGTPICTNGVCGVSNCAPGTADCDGQSANGCETDTTTSATHCGFCNNPCSYPNATGKCVASLCELDACNPGYGNCDGMAANGCESPLDTTSACGSCSLNCASPAPPNATGFACVGGQCTITACAGGFSNPDGTYSDGCECGDDGVSNVCASATVVNPDPVPLGGSGTEGPHTIEPIADQDYFVVDFAGSNDCSYHPKVVLDDPTGALRMDVTTDCASSMGFACSEGGDSTGVLAWEFTYSDVCGPDLAIDPAKTPSPSSVRVRVYAIGAPSQCLSYTLTVSN